MTIEKKWYAVITRPRWEKKLALKLTELGITNYCPLNRVLRQWSDRKKVVLEPLFKGYLFVQLPEASKWDIKNVAGVLNFVYWLGRPAVIKNEEIDTIRRFLQEFENVEVSDKVELNDKVLVKQGIMMNYSGFVIEVLGNRARVMINSMGVALSALFDKKNLEKVSAIS